MVPTVDGSSPEEKIISSRFDFYYYFHYPTTTTTRQEDLKLSSQSRWWMDHSQPNFKREALLGDHSPSLKPTFFSNGRKTDCIKMGYSESTSHFQRNQGFYASFFQSCFRKAKQLSIIQFSSSSSSFLKTKMHYVLYLLYYTRQTLEIYIY